MATTVDGAALGAGAGDNAAAALGLGAREGDVVVSIGTSGVVTAVTGTPAIDPTGSVAGFADATGLFLPLVATLNGARVLDAAARLLGVDHETLSRLALEAPSGAGGLVLVPYLEGERTPNLPDATGSLDGLTLATATRPALARASVEGLLCSLADGLDAVVATGVTPAGAAGRRRCGIRGSPHGRRRGARRARGRPAAGGVRRRRGRPPGGVGALGLEAPPDWAREGTRRYAADPVPSVRERYADGRSRHLDRDHLNFLRCDP